MKILTTQEVELNGFENMIVNTKYSYKEGLKGTRCEFESLEDITFDIEEGLTFQFSGGSVEYTLDEIKEGVRFEEILNHLEDLVNARLQDLSMDMEYEGEVL